MCKETCRVKLGDERKEVCAHALSEAVAYNDVTGGGESSRLACRAVCARATCLPCLQLAQRSVVEQHNLRACGRSDDVSEYGAASVM